MSVRNAASSPTNKPIKIVRIAEGMATRNIRKSLLAPSVLATSIYERRTLAMPDKVSIVTGNDTAQPITAEPLMNESDDSIIAGRTKAVAGIGPTNFNTGIAQ